MNAEWIPASQPPRMTGRYLVTRRMEGWSRGSVELAYYYSTRANWQDVWNEPIHDVVGWMHVPEPMKGEAE